MSKRVGATGNKESRGLGAVRFQWGFQGELQKGEGSRHMEVKGSQGSQPVAVWGQSTSSEGPVRKTPGLSKAQKTARKSGKMVDLTALCAMVGLGVLPLGKLWTIGSVL